MAGHRPTAIVTGALGFAGRHLLAELARDTDWELIGLGRRLGPASDRITSLTCDLRDGDLVRRTIARCRPDVIFHLAAQSYVPKAFASPGETITNNVSGQINILEACRSAALNPTILIVGSAEVYGAVRREELPITEEQPFRPMNPYAVSKVAQDMLGLQYALAYDMRIIRVRPFNHVGPGQSDRFVVATFARQIAEAELGRIEPVVLTGNLEAQRDFLDVRDVVRAYRQLVENGTTGEVYNVASGQAQRIGDLLNQMIEMSSVAITVRQDPARKRPSDIPILVGSAERLREATGWEPHISIAQSLADTVDDWRRRLRHAPPVDQVP